MSEDELIKLMLKLDEFHQALSAIYLHPEPCNDDDAWDKYWEIKMIAIEALANYNNAE